MTPWSWWAGELDADAYDLAAEEPTREAAIRTASRQCKPGEKFQIIEARSSTDTRYESADLVPFLRTRNHEIITVGPISAGATETCPACGGFGRVGPFFPGGMSTICANCQPCAGTSGEQL